jgi:2-polyprenyl-6-hydroxyphenyl methylase/3-demethylubiquinone-9 3-methyltransferase
METEPRPAPPTNVDAAELARFEEAADCWWAPGGGFQALHDINPLRVAYIRRQVDLRGTQVLDVGCGGGILAEALAAAGAEVTGIDLGEAALAAARRHARQSGRAVTYRRVAVEALAGEMPGAFSVVVCMELLEHVPAPASVVAACARLTRPGGHVFFATLNRHPLAWLLAIVMAEDVLRIVPRGTHQYRRFIRPRELQRWAQAAGLGRGQMDGMLYLPYFRRACLVRQTAVNYLAHFRRPALRETGGSSAGDQKAG